MTPDELTQALRLYFAKEYDAACEQAEIERIEASVQLPRFLQALSTYDLTDAAATFDRSFLHDLGIVPLE